LAEPRAGPGEDLPGGAGAGPSAEHTMHRVLLGTDRVRHVHRVAARAGRHADWPEWLPDELRRRWIAAGISSPWAHQSAAAELVRGGRSVVLCTGTASGKSLAYLMPALTAVRESARGPRPGPCGTVLYLAPTKALAADQLSGLSALGLGSDWLRPALCDGDTPHPERDWIRKHANYLLTNPDMLNRTLLPGHARWAGFFGSLQVVVIDECHTYRGVFGAHVAQVIRRLRRLCRTHGAQPSFILTSATVADPGAAAERLTGLTVDEITDDASPRAATTMLLWEPSRRELPGGDGAGRQRSANAEAGQLLADLVLGGARALAFVRSRRGAETVAALAREVLNEAGQIPPGVAAYRGGYLPEERRLLETRLRAGDLRGLATTNALELGIDVPDLDVVLLAGYPGTRASMWQQAGRAGRGARDAVAVLIARDDPLDSYLLHHPEALFDRPTEATVLDPNNPYVLAPHLCAAAAESTLTEADLDLFGPAATATVEALVDAGRLRRRAAGWYWTRRDSTAIPADIRRCGGGEIRLVEGGTGRLIGTVEAAAAQFSVHPGAVHLHQGRSYLATSLDMDAGVALLEPAAPDYSTHARTVSDLAVLETVRTSRWGEAEVHFGAVEVTTRVVSFLSRSLRTGEIFRETPLELPPRTLRTSGVWWTLTERQVTEAGVEPAELAGAAHAVEHAAIGLLPLFAECDRWDIGGVSTGRHPDTGATTVFVHDGHAGGAGFAERGFAAAAQWLRATRDLIADCRCDAGCPSCVHSPECGHGNRPLHKAGAAALLNALLADAPG